MRLLSDNPLRRECEEGDECFNLEGRLRVLVDSLKDPKLATPFSVMVSGSWGTGKTSAMRWLTKTLGGKHKDLRIDTCWFYPWKYQNKEDVWKGLIAEVIIATIDFENVDPRKVLKAVKQFGKFLGAGFIRTVSSIKPKIEATGLGQKGEVELDLKDAFEGITEEYAKHITPQEAYYNAFEETFKRWIADSYGKDKRLIVFIDDLDRCMPDIALQVLEALKLYLNVENLVFVVGVDKEVIDRIVHKRYSDMFGKDLSDVQTQQKAGQYLDKMFQVEVDVQPSDELVENFRELRLANLDWWQRIAPKNQEYFAEVLRKQSGLTPRSVVRTINAALTRVEDPDDAEAVTKSIWRALIELILRGRGDHREAWRLAEGRAFFEQWRKDVRRRRDQDPSARAYVSPGESLIDEKDSEAEWTEEPVASDRVPRRSDTDEFALLHEERFRSFWPLLSDPLLGVLSSIQLEEDEPQPEPDPRPDLTLAKFREVMASSLGIAEADLIDIHLMDLTALDLEGDDVDDYFLEMISNKCLNVQDLDLSDTKVTDAGLKRLSSMTQLQTLYLGWTQVTDAGLDRLSGLTQLQTLYLGWTQVTDAGLERLSGLTQLQTLYLSGTKVTDAGLERLSGLTQLQTLHLSRTQVTDAGLERLSGLTQLQTLNLSGTKVTDAGLERLPGLTQLQTLHLSRTQVTDAGLDRLSGLTRLQDLDLSETQVTDAGLDRLSGLTRLQILNLSGTKVTDAGLDRLSGLTQLQTLYLSGTKVTDAGLDRLSGLTRLQRLYLSRTQVTDAGLDRLSGLTRLQTLHLSRTQVTDAGLDRLQSHMKRTRIVR